MNKKVNVTGFAYKIGSNENHSFGSFIEIKEFGSITLEECKEIYQNLQINKLKADEYAKSLTIDLSEYDNYEENGIPMIFEENTKMIGDEIIATYNIELNRLRILKNGRPIYENWDGNITDDEDALVDSLM